MESSWISHFMKCRTPLLTAKFMTMLFKDFEGILPMEYLPHKAETVNDGYYAGLQKMKQAVKKNCQRNLQKVSCFFMTILLYTSHKMQLLHK